jgi:beta propeller repeat protein
MKLIFSLTMTFMRYQFFRKMSFVNVLLLPAFLAVFLSAHIALAGTEVQITNDSADQFAPYITGDKIVWEDWRNFNNPEIYMYDLTDHAEFRITDNSWGQYMPVVSGDHIFWTDFRPGNLRRDIYMYDLVTHVETNVINKPEDQYLWGVSGARIVWSDDRNTFKDIYTYDLVTQIETRITNGNVDHTINSTPVISGDKVVWQKTGENQNWDYEIYVYDLATGVTSKVITDLDHNQQLPSISGDKVVWQDDRNGNEDIYMYDFTTHTESQITHDSSNQVTPKISDNRIVWLDGRNHDNSAYDIYAYDLITHAESRITTDDARADNISVSGNRIVWSDWRNGRPDIYMYEIDTPPINVNPIAQISPVSTIILGQAVTFDGSGSIDSDGTIANYHWDFGDGSNGDGVTASHTYASAGTYQVMLTVTDDDGAIASAMVSVLVDAPPVAVITPVVTVILGEVTTFDGSTSIDSDGMITNYSWNFGDGTDALGSGVAHTYVSAGSYQVTLTVTDNDGAMGMVMMTAVVQTPVQALNGLITTVQTMNLAHGITNSLDAKLQNASAALSATNANNRSDAINKLQAFISATQAQSGNQLTTAQANRLIAMANRIITGIGL